MGVARARNAGAVAATGAPALVARFRRRLEADKVAREVPFLQAHAGGGAVFSDLESTTRGTPHTIPSG